MKSTEENVGIPQKIEWWERMVRHTKRGKGGREKREYQHEYQGAHNVLLAESMGDLVSIALVITRAKVPTPLCHQSSPFL